jgi:hypothetical protein
LAGSVDRCGILPVRAGYLEKVVDIVVFARSRDQQAIAGDVDRLHEVFEEFLAAVAASNADGNFDLDANAMTAVARRGRENGFGEWLGIDRFDLDRSVSESGGAWKSKKVLIGQESQILALPISLHL